MEAEAFAIEGARSARVSRTTKETDIQIALDLDGVGRTRIDTGVPFFDHMLDAFGRHGLVDLDVHAKGDIEVDAHHTVEDTGIVLGQAVAQALGDKRGIVRFGTSFVPMDESLVQASLDISGRGQLHYAVDVAPAEILGIFDTSLGQEFFIAFATNAAGMRARARRRERPSHRGSLVQGGGPRPLRRHAREPPHRRRAPVDERSAVACPKRRSRSSTTAKGT